MNLNTSEHALADIESLHLDSPHWFKDCFALPRESDYVTVAGTDIHYLRWGNPALPGVLMTHGFMAHARCWAFIAPLLAERFCLVAFDLSGMGDSGWRDKYNVEMRAQECQAVAQAAGLTTDGRRPALVCHSFGGSVGLAAAEAYPDVWRSILICDMSMLAPGETSQFMQDRQRMENRAVRPHRISTDFAEVRQRFRLAPDQPCANEFLLEYMAWHSVQAVEGGFVWKFDPRIMGPDNERDLDWFQSIAPRFAHLDLPRAIIYGQHSIMMSDKARAYMAAETGGTVPMVKIHDAHHHLMLDQPLAFAAAIDALLQSMSG